MPRPELPAAEKRDKPITAMVTASEKDAVAQVARDLGMSLSNAARYLLNKGLANHPSPPPKETDRDH